MDELETKNAPGEAPVERKQAIESLEWGRRALIPDLKDSLRSYVYANDKMHHW